MTYETALCSYEGVGEGEGLNVGYKKGNCSHPTTRTYPHPPKILQATNRGKECGN